MEQFNQTPQAMTAGARFDFALATQVPNTYAVDTPAVTWLTTRRLVKTWDACMEGRVTSAAG